MLLNLFAKMQESIKRKIEYHAHGLYISIAFPIAVAFLFTFIGSRLFSVFWPQFYVQWGPGLRVHHYAYGFFVLAAAGYLGLVFTSPRARYLLALLLGFGLGLAFDEFGMWLRLRDDDPARWSYDGFNLVIGTLVLIFSVRGGLRLLSKLWPF